MRLYSYRGVIYTVASSPNAPAPASSPVPNSTEKQDIFTTIPQTKTPTAAIPMRYRGVLYLLERFNPFSSEVKQMDPRDESQEARKLADD